MKTSLLEFSNDDGQIIRGIMTSPDQEIKKAVICIHGFERCSSTEKKFKTLSDTLAQNMVATLRLDFSGCGLSDGDFRLTTIERQGNDLTKAIQQFKKEIGDYKVNIVAHSLGACVLANKLDEIKNEIDKIILIAPALNQKELLKYRFVTSQMKKSNPDIEITRQNYQEYLDEPAFLKDCQRTDKMTKANYINAQYFLEAKDLDLRDKFEDNNSNILHIHGTKDVAVPIQSVNINFKNQIIVENGDHDLEKPNQIEQWQDKALDFLIK